MADHIKFIIWTNGDRSVGLNGDRAEVTIDTDEEPGSVDYNEHLANVREELVECFSNIWGEKPHIATEQELDQQREPD